MQALVIATTYSRLTHIQKALEATDWQLDVAQDPKAAVENLRTERYDAVFCDEDLRGASASGFLAWTKRLAEGVPFYLVRAPGSDGKLRGEQPSAVLDYPLKPDQLPKPGQSALSAPNAAQPDRRFTTSMLSGNTSLVAIADILEMMGIAKQSALLSFGDDTAHVYVNNGILVHAEAKQGQSALSGLPALALVLILENAEFQVQPFTPPPRPTINLPVTTAMTEAARLADEQRRYQDLIDAVRDACPSVSAVTTGYLMGGSPSQGYGDSDALFGEVKALFSSYSEPAGGKLQELLIASETSVLALQRFGDDNVVAARAPAKDRAHLYEAVRDAVAEQLQNA